MLVFRGSRAATLVIAGVAVLSALTGTAGAQVLDEATCLGPYPQVTDPGVALPETCAWGYADPSPEGGIGAGASVGGVTGASVRVTRDDGQFPAYDGACASVTIFVKTHERCLP